MWKVLETAMILALLLSALLFAGCIRQDQTIINRKIPHRIAKPATVYVVTTRPDGTTYQQRITIDAGWWIASPELIEGE